MSSGPSRILLEGRPGAGKTIVARRLAALLGERGVRPAGFTTEEIRAGGRRVGFGIETMSGERGVLAHVDRPGPPRVGKYGVDVVTFERLGLPALEDLSAAVVIVDEIGKMELISTRFREAVVRLLDAPRAVVATVHVFAHPFTDALKARDGVEVLHVTKANRERFPRELADRWRKRSEVTAMARTVELRRHTAAENDILTPEGVRAALGIGASLAGGYQVAVSSGAQRATQTLACFLAASGARVPGGVIVDTGLRSEREDSWFAAARDAGGGDLNAFLDADRVLVGEDAQRFADAVRRVAALLEEGGRALVVGHSPMNEAAVWGLTGQVVPPISKGGGVLVIEEGGRFRVG